MGRSFYANVYLLIVSNTMEHEGRESQVYEIAYQLTPSVLGEEVTKTVQALHDIISKNGGAVIAEEAPKTMRLAYTMVKHVAGKNYKYDMAQFGWIKFEGPASAAIEAKGLLEKHQELLRVLLVKTVRENTLYGHHIAAIKAATHAREADTQRREAAKKEVTGPVSEAEVDKAIEDLVAE